MTYLTEFRTLEITGNIVGNGNISINGNVNANNEILSNTQTIGNLLISSNTVNANGNVSTTVSFTGTGTPVPNVNFNNANYVFQSNVTVGTSNGGAVSNLTIPGGTQGQYLGVGANGQLFWSTPQGQGNGVVGGSPGAIEINNGLGFGGDSGNFYANFTTVTSNANVVTTTIQQINLGVPLNFDNTYGNAVLLANSAQVFFSTSNISISGGGNGQVLYSWGSNSRVYWGDLPSIVPGGVEYSLQVATVDGNGILSGFTGTANALYTDNGNGGIFSVGGPGQLSMTRATAGNYTVTTGANAANLVFQTAGNVALGNVDKVKIGGGANTFILTTDGSSNLTWGSRTIYSVTQVNTASYSANAITDDIISVSTAANVIITLPDPAPANLGAFFHIKDTWGGGRANSPIVITTTTAANVIDGQAEALINGDWNSIQIAQVSNTAWGVI